MNRFNLSAWAIAHRSIVYFLMLAIVVVGIASYLRLGRNEDPTFTIKTMVVQAQWPGATLEDTLLQVTERIERKLQETPHLDYLKSYTKAGQSTVFVYLKGSTGPKAVHGHLVPGSQEGARHRADLAVGCAASCLRRRVRRHLWHRLRLHCGRVHASPVARLCRGYPLAAAAGARRRQGEPHRRPA